MPILKTVPKSELGQFVITAIGEPKVGKTKTFARFPSPVFLFTEQGAADMSVPYYCPPGWNQNGYAYIMTKPSDYDNFIVEVFDMPPAERPKTVVFDTIDGAILSKVLAVTGDARVDSIYEGELAFGRGLDKVRLWAAQIIRDFQTLGMGLVFITHLEERSVQQPGVEPRTVWRSTLPDKIKPLIHGVSDFIWYFKKEGKKRYIYTQSPDLSMEAGSRITLPERIPMGNSPEEAYQNILAAFYARGQEEAAADKAKEELVRRILTGESYLAENKIDNFDVPARRGKSRNKHLGTETLELASLDVLQAYLGHLKDKAKEAKNVAGHDRRRAVANGQ
jgi:hypothetical protein